MRTFQRKKGGGSGLEKLLAAFFATSTTPLTYELNSSMLLLPKEPMKPRLHDDRVGYFAVSYKDFDENPQGVKYKANITRWRLEPKDEDREKYLRGELVEPKKPIIIYIDPATPKKWVPYLIQGVNDWQAAFEKAGFKMQSSVRKHRRTILPGAWKTPAIRLSCISLPIFRTQADLTCTTLAAVKFLKRISTGITM